MSTSPASKPRHRTDNLPFVNYLYAGECAGLTFLTSQWRATGNTTILTRFPTTTTQNWMLTYPTLCLRAVSEHEHCVSKLGYQKTLVYSVALVFICRSNIACMFTKLNFVRAMFSLARLIRWLKGIYVRASCLAMIYLSWCWTFGWNWFIGKTDKLDDITTARWRCLYWCTWKYTIA